MVVFKGVVSYPIPAYANVPIEAQYYAPSRFVISAITLGVTTTVTTSVVHNYVIGQEVRLIIPRSYGCIQLNERKGFVLSLPSTTQIELNINSTNSDIYIASLDKNVAQTLAIGDVNSGAINAQGRINNGTFIPGSFIDISPL